MQSSEVRKKVEIHRFGDINFVVKLCVVTLESQRKWWLFS